MNELVDYKGVQNYWPSSHWVVNGFEGLSNVTPQTERKPLGDVGSEHSSEGIDNSKLTWPPF